MNIKLVVFGLMGALCLLVGSYKQKQLVWVQIVLIIAAILVKTIHFFFYVAA